MNAFNVSDKNAPLQSADEFVQLAERMTQIQHPEVVRHAVKDIFCVLRDCLPFENSLEFLNLLPMSFKAVYLDGWHVGSNLHVQINSMEEFLDEVIASPFVDQGWYNSSRDELRNIVKSILGVIGVYNKNQQSMAKPDFLPNDIQYFILHAQHSYSEDSAIESSIWFS